MCKFVRCLIILIVVTATSSRAVFGAAFNVDIINFTFQPSSLNIQAGDTVTWTQKDVAPHTSTSDTGVWNGNWTSIATNSVTFADWMFTDTTGTNVRYRFYRVLTPGAQ